MAETKQAKSKKPRSKKSSNGSSSKAKASSAKDKAKDKAGKASSSASTNGGQSKAQSVASGIGPAVQKAKVPLIAGGAAVAGVAGAVLAATHSGGKRKVLGVSVPKRSKRSLPKKGGLKPDAHKIAGALTDAAKRADHFGQNVSRIASSVQKVGESADEAVKKG